MGTTVEKLNKVLETKEAIRTAINSKGGTLTESDTFASYPSAIDSLPSGGSLKTLLDTTKSAYALFYHYSGTSVDDLISYDDTGNVTDMSEMFNGCVNLVTIPQLNTSNVTTMEKFFSYCRKVTIIPQLDTSKVTSMNSMFSNCDNLTIIPQLDTHNVIYMSYMFESCPKLTTIDITHMNTTSVYYSSRFAAYCFSLTKLIIRNMDTIPVLSSDSFNSCYHFIGTVNSTYNPNGLKDGRIYVPDDKVEELKTATNWSVYADIIVPLSTLVE